MRKAFDGQWVIEKKSEKRGERHKKHPSDGPNGALWARLLVQSVWEEQMTSLNFRRDKGKSSAGFTLDCALPVVVCLLVLFKQ